MECSLKSPDGRWHHEEERQAAEAAVLEYERTRVRGAVRLEDLGKPGSGFYGQSHVTKRLRRVMERRAAQKARGPHNIAFFGPPGVGKTELARLLAASKYSLTYEEMQDAGLIHIFDMGQCSTEEAANKFFGAHAGYAGGAGQLYEAVRRNPEGVVVLDEIERAHPRARISLLPVLNQPGHIQSNQAGMEELSTEGMTFVVTSNLGQDSLSNLDGSGGPSKVLEDAVFAEFRSTLDSAFCDRFADKFCFVPLSAQNRKDITFDILVNLRHAYSASALQLTWSPAACERLSSKLEKREWRGWRGGRSFSFKDVTESARSLDARVKENVDAVVRGDWLDKVDDEYGDLSTSAGRLHIGVTPSIEPLQPASLCRFFELSGPSSEACGGRAPKRRRVASSEGSMQSAIGEPLGLAAAGPTGSDCPGTIAIRAPAPALAGDPHTSPSLQGESEALRAHLEQSAQAHEEALRRQSEALRAWRHRATENLRADNEALRAERDQARESLQTASQARETELSEHHRATVRLRREIGAVQTERDEAREAASVLCGFAFRLVLLPALVAGVVTACSAPVVAMVTMQAGLNTSVGAFLAAMLLIYCFGPKSVSKLAWHLSRTFFDYCSCSLILGLVLLYFCCSAWNLVAGYKFLADLLIAADFFMRCRGRVKAVIRNAVTQRFVRLWK